jgi:SapC protein
MLVERPIALEKDVLRRRIYAPLAYAPVRNTAVVPIVHSECMVLASWFPVVWRRCNSTVELVTVRALLDDQGAQSAAARALLPLRLHAYPFIFDPARPIDAASPRMLDDVFADAPTDAGATITNVNRKLGRATTMRLAILGRIAAETEVTAAIGKALAERDLFEPWPLNFDIEGITIGIPDLLVVRPPAFDDASLAPLVAQHGLPCATMLGLHRISLFRAGSLLAAARSFVSTTLTKGRQASRGENAFVAAVS